MPQYKTIRHLDPQPTIRVYVPNNPRKLEPVRLALKLQTKTMAQLVKSGRRLIKNFLRAKRAENDQALAYFGSRLKQVSAEHRFRVTKKTP